MILLSFWHDCFPRLSVIVVQLCVELMYIRGGMVPVLLFPPWIKVTEQFILTRNPTHYGFYKACWTRDIVAGVIYLSEFKMPDLTAGNYR